MSLNKNDMINATTNVAGMEILNRSLADWIWQGIQHLQSEKAEHQANIESLNKTIKEMLVAHYCLLGAEKENAESAANDYINFLNVSR